MHEPIKIFGHKVPDTDATVSAIAYAWYYTHINEQPATPYILGELNNETRYVLDHFGVATPAILGELSEGDRVVIVDTNNMHELPSDMHQAELIEIIDHHKLTGGIETSTPITITLRPMASTASLIYTLLNPELHEIPREIAGIMLAGILSDTLEFRSPTTTDEDRAIAESLAQIADTDIHTLAEGMFAAKSDISSLSVEDLIMMDSKVFDIKGKKLRVSVIETMSPAGALAQTDAIKSGIASHVSEHDDVDEVLLFVIDILNEQATPIIATDTAREILHHAFEQEINDDTILKGVVSRKKQIIPRLEA